MILYYNRDGHPIDDVLAWAQLFENQAYKRVATTILENGTRISTIWLGLDHSFNDGPPMIFETMVFPPESWNELDMERYTTEAEAVAGHEAMVNKWSAKVCGK